MIQIHTNCEVAWWVDVTSITDKIELTRGNIFIKKVSKKHGNYIEDFHLVIFFYFFDTHEAMIIRLFADISCIGIQSNIFYHRKLIEIFCLFSLDLKHISKAKKKIFLSADELLFSQIKNE